MKRRLTSLCVLVLALVCVFVLPATAQAATEGDYTYKVSKGKAIITDYTGQESDLTIPSVLGGYPVRKIDKNAFSYCQNLTSVTIPDSVVTIGTSAFHYCKGLTSVTFGDRVTTIGYGAFEDCSGLTSVTIPDSVTTIEWGAFENCAGLTSVTLSDSVITIGQGAFRNCTELTEITIPDSVTGIGQGAFSGCSSLSAVTIGNGVTSISNSAFSSCDKLTSITIPDNVITIGDGAFKWDFNLTSVTIPDSVTTIGARAFEYCYGLSSITLPNSVTTIGSRAFGNCKNLTAITIPASVTKLEDRVFFACTSLTSIRVDKDNPKYSSDKCGVLFNKKKTKLLQAPRGISGAYKIPDGVTSVGEHAFEGCTGLTSVKIPDSVKTIGAEAFILCKNLTSVKIFGDVTTIKESTFYLCESLASVSIPDSVMVIEDFAFDECNSLTDVHYDGYATQLAFVTVGDGNDDFLYARLHCKWAATIITQPQNVAVAKNKTAKVKVEAFGDGLKYQWYYAKKGSSKFKKLSGATKATYSVKMTSKVNGRKVYCVVKDKYGNTVKTETVTLYIGKPVKIKTQPKNVTVAKNKTAKVTVKATGDGLKYQWYYAEKGSSEFKKRSGATKATYSVKMTSKVDGRSVCCVVTDKYGNAVATEFVTLYMGTPAKITTQPKNVTVKKNKVAKVTVKATGDGLKYQWYYAAKGSSEFTKLKTTKATYSVKMTSKVDGRRVYCVVTDKYGNTVKTKTVTLKMK